MKVNLYFESWEELKRVNMAELPDDIIPGHFWVERDGKIIDPRLTPCRRKKYYKEASPELQQEAIKKYINSNRAYFKKEIHAIMADDPDGIFYPIYGMCHFNAYAEHILYGGRICYGESDFIKSK